MSIPHVLASNATLPNHYPLQTPVNDHTPNSLQIIDSEMQFTYVWVRVFVLQSSEDFSPGPT